MPLFEITEPSYWLIDKAQAAEYAVATSPRLPPPSQPRPGWAVTVSGQVPVENCTQLFASFICPLIDNRVELTVSITGCFATAKSLAGNSTEYKTIKGSAQQLGLTLEEEKGR